MRVIINISVLNQKDINLITEGNSYKCNNNDEIRSYKQLQWMDVYVMFFMLHRCICQFEFKFVQIQYNNDEI